MRLVSKAEVDQIAGSGSFWNPIRIVGVCTYLAGVPDMDERIGTSNFFKVMPIVNFEKRNSGLYISMTHNFKFLHSALNIDHIINIAVEKGGIADIKERSVIGRAIVGGLILGPLGALIGGASGVKDKVTMIADTLVITFNQDGRESVLLFEIVKGKTGEVSKFLRQHFPTISSIQ